MDDQVRVPEPPRKRLGWGPVLAVTAVAFAPLLVLKGIGAVLPPVEAVTPDQQVIVGDKTGDGWSVKVRDAHGAPLMMQPKTNGFIGGYTGKDEKVLVQSVQTTDDTVLAVNRSIRAGFSSAVVPDGAGRGEGKVVSVYLTPEQARSVDKELPDGAAIAGVAVRDPKGMDGETVVAVVEGPREFVDNVVSQIERGAE